MVKNKDKNKIENRYDKILKELLDNKILMKQLITGFINEDWVKNIDFKTLKKEKTDFLSEDLKELIMLDKINKFIKLISSDKINVEDALQTLNKEDKMGGMMRLLNEIEERGEKKGIEKGIEKGKIETAIEILKDGAEIAFVQKYTKLPIKKVKDLQKELNIESN